VEHNEIGLDDVRRLADVELIAGLRHLVRTDQALIARLLVHLGEDDERRLEHRSPERDDDDKRQFEGRASVSGPPPQPVTRTRGRTACVNLERSSEAGALALRAPRRGARGARTGRRTVHVREP
jgi:hypothetical protein